MNLKRTWARAEQTPAPRPPGKAADSLIANMLNDATRVNTPPHRQAKVGAYGNRGRTLGLHKQRDKS